MPVSITQHRKFGQVFALFSLVRTVERNCLRRVDFLLFCLCFFLFFFLQNSVPIEPWSAGIHPHNGNKAPNKRSPNRWTERTGKSDISMPSYPPSSCFFPLRSTTLRVRLSCSIRQPASRPSFFSASPIFFSILLAASIACFDARGTPLRIRTSIEIAP